MALAVRALPAAAHRSSADHTELVGPPTELIGLCGLCGLCGLSGLSGLYTVCGLSSGLSGLGKGAKSEVV